MPEKLIKKIRTSEGDLQIDYNALANLPDLSEVGVQADWNETDTTAKSYIKNRTHYTDENGNVKRLDSKYMPLGVVTGVTVTNITGGHRVTLTTNSGTKTIDVMDGKTPSVGNNGNWIIDGIDTGVSASGLQANADWTQKDETAVDYIKNKPRVGNDHIVLTDTENGYNYVVQIRGGSLVSFCAVANIQVTEMPTKIVYMRGQKFDTSGMVITATCEDGSTKIIDNYTCIPDTLMTLGDTVQVEILYEEFGKSHSAFVFVTVAEFDPETELIDFAYTANDDGTYTITGWQGTTNGETGTEMIIPDNALIKL